MLFTVDYDLEVTALGETQSERVEDTAKLVKEDGKWLATESFE